VKKDFARAIKDYDEAIRLDPKFADAYHNRGSAWSDRKDFDRAIRDFDEAIRLDPKDPYPFNGRGDAWRRKKDYARALADYADAEAGQFAEAVRWQQKALEDAAFAMAHGQRARERLELYKQNKPYREP